MGVMDGLIGGIGGLITAGKNRKDQQRANEENRKILEGLDYDPAYVSDHTPAYQQTQSPVARAHLESILTGNNPATTFSGSPNAGITKGFQQASQNAMYGTPEQRQAAGQQAQAFQYMATKPTMQVGRSDSGGSSDLRAAEYANSESAGLTKDLSDAFREKGIGIAAAKGKNSGSEGAFRTLNKKGMDGFLSDDQTRTAIEMYNNGASPEEINAYLESLGKLPGRRPDHTRG